MDGPRSNLTKSLLSIASKTLATTALWVGTALLARFQLAPDAVTLTAIFRQMPSWAIISLVVFLPVAWLSIEFAAVCFLEFRAQLLEETAPRFARKVSLLPTAIRESLARARDRAASVFDHFRFEGHYRRLIAEDCRRLHRQTGLLHQSSGFPLEEVYTELSMASTQFGEVKKGLFSATIRGRESIYNFLRFQNPATILAILGRPGGGKSTLFRHLALLFALNKQGKHRLRRRLPVLIELRRVTEMFTDSSHGDWQPPTLIEVVQRYWSQNPSLKDLAEPKASDWLRIKLAKGRVVVMVDGLDEIPHVQNPANPNAQTPRERVSSWLENEIQRKDQRNSLFLVTSRPGGFEEAPITERVTVLEVQPLTLLQSRQFIYSFFLGCERHNHPAAKKTEIRENANRATAELEVAFRNKPHLSDLRVNPLLLHMICLLHHLRGRLPEDRADLYKETCEVLLNRDLRAPGIKEQVRVVDKLALLRPLANFFMRSGNPSAKSTDVLLNVLAPIFRTVNYPSEGFFEFVANDSGLLQEIEPGYWDFAHKTFYEYLTAEYWDRNPPSNDDLRSWVDKDWWRVTLLFYSSRSEDSPVIPVGLEANTPRAWSLAYSCIHAGHRVNEGVRSLARKHFDEALSNPRETDRFVPAAVALMDLRMRDFISDSKEEDHSLRRSTLISNAEYQLFLTFNSEKDSRLLMPPHWMEPFFCGLPTEPVLGVTKSQADAFASWVFHAPRLVSGSASYDFPLWNASNLPNGTIPWSANVVEVGGPQTTDVLRFDFREETITSSWMQALGSAIARVSRTRQASLPHLVGRAIWLELSYILCRAQMRNPPYLRSLYRRDVFESRVRARYEEIGAVFLNNVMGSSAFMMLNDSDLPPWVEYVLCHSIVHSLTKLGIKSGFDFAKGIDDFEAYHSEILALKEQSPLTDLSLLQSNLLNAAVGVLASSDDPTAFKHRKAGLEYGVLIGTLLTGLEDTAFAALQDRLSLLLARYEGNSMPVEAIELRRAANPVDMISH